MEKIKIKNIENIAKSYKFGVLFVLLQIIGYPIAFLNSDSYLGFFLMAIVDIIVLFYFKKFVNKISNNTSIDKLINVSIVFSFLIAFIYLFKNIDNLSIFDFLSQKEQNKFFSYQRFIDICSIAVSILGIVIGFKLKDVKKLFDNLVEKFRLSFIGINFILILVFIFSTVYNNPQNTPQFLEIFFGFILTPVLIILTFWNKTLLIKLFSKE